jgi:hypothetical protein
MSGCIDPLSFLDLRDGLDKQAGKHNRRSRDLMKFLCIQRSNDYMRVSVVVRGISLRTPFLHAVFQICVFGARVL